MNYLIGGFIGLSVFEVKRHSSRSPYTIAIVIDFKCNYTGTVLGELDGCVIGSDENNSLVASDHIKVLNLNLLSSQV